MERKSRPGQCRSGALARTIEQDPASILDSRPTHSRARRLSRSGHPGSGYSKFKLVKGMTVLSKVNRPYTYHFETGIPRLLTYLHYLATSFMTLGTRNISSTMLLALSSPPARVLSNQAIIDVPEYTFPETMAVVCRS